jgi:response regulator of citrate/malate metabolism
MKQDNPFAKLGAIDQKLFEDTASIKQEKVDKEEEEKKQRVKSQKVNKILVEENVRKSESQQNDLSENQQSDKVTLSTKTAKRFTTYLTKTSLRAIRIIADNEDRHDYEVFQEAIDFYLAHRNQ